MLISLFSAKLDNISLIILPIFYILYYWNTKVIKLQKINLKIMI